MTINKENKMNSKILLCGFVALLFSGCLNDSNNPMSLMPVDESFSEEDLQAGTLLPQTIVWNGDRVMLGAIKGNVGDIVRVPLKIFTTRTCQVYQVNFMWDNNIAEVVSEERGRLCAQWAFAEANWEQIPGWCAIGAFTSGSGIILGRADKPISGELFILNFRIKQPGAIRFHMTYEMALDGYVLIPPLESNVVNLLPPFNFPVN